MTDKERLNKNKAFSLKAAPVLATMMQKNDLAAERAAGTATLSVETDGKNKRYRIRMLTSRGKHTIPIGRGWTTSGEAVITSSRDTLMMILSIFNIGFADFENEFAPGYGKREVELREVVEKLNPQFA